MSKRASTQGNANTMAEWLGARRPGGTSSDSRHKRCWPAARDRSFTATTRFTMDSARKDGRLGGLFRAVHIGTHHPVLLYFLPRDWTRRETLAARHRAGLAWACYAGSSQLLANVSGWDLGKFRSPRFLRIYRDFDRHSHGRQTPRTRGTPTHADLATGGAGVSRLHQHGSDPWRNFDPIILIGGRTMAMCRSSSVTAGAGPPLTESGADRLERRRSDGKLLLAAENEAPEIS